MFRPHLEPLEDRFATSAPTRCGASAPPVITSLSVEQHDDDTWTISGTFTDDRPSGTAPFAGSLVVVGVPGVAVLGVGPLWLPESGAHLYSVPFTVEIPTWPYPYLDVYAGMPLAAVVLDVGCESAGPSFDFTL